MIPDHVSEWLELLGLGQYASNFIDRGICGNIFLFRFGIEFEYLNAVALAAN